MKVRFLVVFILALAAFISPGPAAAKSSAKKVKESVLPNGLKVLEYRLPNGLQLLLVPDHSAPVFTFQKWFKVGSATEKLDPKLKKTGLAHLFEHMMFRGTPKHPDGQFDQLLSEAGGEDMNATTSWDRTNYFQSLPKDKFELVFQLESDRMTNLKLDEKLFKTELGAVFGELKMRKDKPSTVAFFATMDLAFEKHPYKWDIIGTPDELNSFTVADAQYFYKTYYAPNNATVILLGDFPVERALTLTEKYYGKMKPQEIPAHETEAEPAQKKARDKRIQHPLATANIYNYGFMGPAINHADMAAMETLTAVLSYGDGSILQQQLVEKGLASAATASTNTLRYPSPFVIQVTASPSGNEKEILKAVGNALERVRNGELTEKELERAKNQYLLYAYGQLLRHDNIGRYLGESLVSGDDYMRGFEILTQVKGVTLADLKRVAGTYLQKHQQNLVIVEKGK